MATSINYHMPSRCSCGSPLVFRPGGAWCGGCGAVACQEFVAAQHPRGKNGQFGSGGDENVHAATANDEIKSKAVQNALKYFTDAEKQRLPRIVLALKRPAGVPENVAGFVVPGYPAIYIATWSDTYGAAMRGDKDSEMLLAGEIAHEAAHVANGPDENQAYDAGISLLNRIGASQGLIDRVRAAKASVARGK